MRLERLLSCPTASCTDVERSRGEKGTRSSLTIQTPTKIVSMTGVDVIQRFNNYLAVFTEHADPEIMFVHLFLDMGERHRGNNPNISPKVDAPPAVLGEIQRPTEIRFIAKMQRTCL